MITLSRFGHLELPHRLFGEVVIPSTVFEEVAIAGRGRPGAEEVVAAVRSGGWLKLHQSPNPREVRKEQVRWGLGAGETSVILLAQALQAELVLLDDRSARKRASQAGLVIGGTLRVLELAFQSGYLQDLQGAYRALIATGFYIEQRLLDASLRRNGLPPL